MCQFQGLTVGGVFRRTVDVAGQNQRGTGLVDQHTVGFVDDGKTEPAQQKLSQPVVVGIGRFQLQTQLAAIVAEQQPVTQIIEGNLLVGAVGDVTGIPGAALFRSHALGDIADRQTECPIERAHPFCIPFHQVFVDGDDMHRDTGQGRGCRRQSRRQGFALAGFHFRQLPLEHHPTGHQLGIVMPQLQRAIRQLADQGKGPDAERIAQSPAAEPAAQLDQQPIELRCIQSAQSVPLAANVGGNFAQAGLPIDAESRQRPLQSTEGAIEPSAFPVTPFGITA